MQPFPTRPTLGLALLLLLGSCSQAPQDKVSVPLAQYARQIAAALGSPLWNLDAAAARTLLQLYLVPGIEHILVQPTDPKSPPQEAGQRPAQASPCQVKQPIVYRAGENQVQVGTLLISPRCEALS